MNRGLITLFAVLALSPAFAGTAMAQSTVNGYNQTGPAIQDDVAGQSEGGSGGAAAVAPTAPAASADTDASGRLPFTGMDLGLLAAAGGLLLGLGAGMRQLTRAPESA